MSNVVKEKIVMRIKETFQQDGKKCISLSVKRGHSDGDGLEVNHTRLQSCWLIRTDVLDINELAPQKTVVQCMPHSSN